MFGWKEIVMEPLKNMFNIVAIYLPYLFGAMIILLAGWLVAKIVSGLVQQGLDKVKFNDFAGKVGLSEVLSKGGASLSPSALVSAFVYWVLIIVVLAATFQAIGLEVVAKLLMSITGYVPNVFSAVFVAFVGMFLANVLSGIVRTAANNVKVPRAELLASITKIGILLFTVLSALEQLNIATFFVTTTFHIFFAAVCLALAISFGIGGKDLAARILWDFYNEQNQKK